MANYKADTTLNERDSLVDLLAQEKQLMRLYCYAISEGCSDKFRKLVKILFERTCDTQIKTFFLMTERDYYRVTSADYNHVEVVKQKFEGVEEELY